MFGNKSESQKIKETESYKKSRMTVWNNGRFESMDAERARSMMPEWQKQWNNRKK